MSEAQPMTLAQIEAQLSAAREHLASLDAEAKELALPIVNGDREAAEALANIQKSIRQTAADIAVLNNAKIAAAQAERAVQLATEAGARARHKEAARGHAAELVKLAARADELVASYKVLLGELAEAERKIGSALRDAGERPNTAIVGRHDLAQFVVGRMLAVSNGREKFLLEQRPTAAIAEVAWADLLGSDNDNEAA